MRAGWGRVVVGLAGLAGLLGAAVADAQARPAGSADSLFRRAQRLVNEGDSTGGRALVDSLLRTTRDGSDARANALFWRATLAADSTEAQRDYLTIAIDHALSPRAADALLRLGQAGYARGDRAAAMRHLERLVLEHPASEAAVDGWYWLGRARIAERELATGCVALDSARRRLKAGDVERSSRIAFAAQPCRMLAVTPPAVAPPGSPAGAPPSGTLSRRPLDSTTRPRWSVQVAAYKLEADAEKLAANLKTRGYDARVDKLSLFHVRVGMFRTRAEAATVVARLKQRQINAIVVEVTRRAP
jgi:cell division septation protein DedD